MDGYIASLLFSMLSDTFLSLGVLILLREIFEKLSLFQQSIQRASWS